MPTVAVETYEVKQMVRTLGNAQGPEGSGVDLAQNVDWEISQWLNKGYTLESTVFTGNTKNGNEEFPRFLYIFVKYPNE